MADIVIKELKERVAHYEAIMMRCPQCKTSLPGAEAQPAETLRSRLSRSSRSALQPSGNTAPPVLTGASDQPPRASEPSLSARRSKQDRPEPRKEPRKGSRVSEPRKNPRPIEPAAPSNQSRRPTDAPISSSRHPPNKSQDLPNTHSGKTSTANTTGQKPTSSKVPPAGSLPIGPSHAKGKQSHTGTIIPIDLPLYNRVGPRRHAEWMRTADIMLGEVPFGQHWREKIMAMDSSLIAAVAVGIPPVSQRQAPKTVDDERKELVRLVRTYAQRYSGGRVKFQQFILVCLCNVLLSQGVSQSTIVETLQICISDTAKRTVERYLKGGTWVNKLMNELFFTDWGFRAVDLIVIWDRTTSTYGSFSVAGDSCQYFLTELTQRKYFEEYREVPDRRHDTIPWIVKKELGDDVSYGTICKVLGYSHEYFERTRHLHSSSSSNPEFNDSEDPDHEDSDHEDSNHEDSDHEDSDHEDSDHEDSDHEDSDHEDSDHEGSENEDPDNEDSENEDSTSRNSSFRTARQSTVSDSSRRRPIFADKTPSSPSTSASGPSDTSLLRKQFHQEGISNNTAGGGLQGGQSVVSPRTQPMIPDRSAKPLGDSEDLGRRRLPNDPQGVTELLFSTSLGEPAPRTQSTKRRLPDSPTSAMQPNNTTRRRQQIGNESSREESGSPLQP